MGAQQGTLYRLEPLTKRHDRAAFHCGAESLDLYLKTQASQDMRRKANAVFVLVPQGEPGRIAGYFTLCAYGLAPGAVPDAVRKLIPRYPWSAPHCSAGLRSMFNFRARVGCSSAGQGPPQRL